MTAVDHLTIQTNGIQLHAVQSGPPDGPLVLLLHGFPEFWYGWRGQIGPLAQAGYRVLAPDLRGYNLSDKPRGVKAYQIRHLVADVVGLIHASGNNQALLVGHDWGGTLAWEVATQHPQVLSRLAILNGPQVSVYLRFLRKNLSQSLKSWYILFFQIRKIPETTLRANNNLLLEKMLLNSSKPGAFSEVDLGRYQLAWSQPGALTASLNWYRAGYQMRRQGVFNPPTPPLIQVPTLIFWALDDPALHPNLGRAHIEICTHGRLIELPQATHWLQHEEADLINAHLLDFFT